jgi:hypothetical protein
MNKVSHLDQPLEGNRRNHKTSKDTTRRTININHRKIKEEGGREENNNAFKTGLIFSFSFSLSSAFVQVYICVAFSVFIIFSMCDNSRVSLRSS